ncbi:hypothetical protein VNO80_29211 [Phaseolus coccineus]|uniref:Uncharacterized protein n=1 Tax=Phaseolus coccineus TaxID=3886 RepID=A0AAN9LAX6_PHACN
MVVQQHQDYGYRSHSYNAPKTYYFLVDDQRCYCKFGSGNPYLDGGCQDNRPLLEYRKSRTPVTISIIKDGKAIEFMKLIGRGPVGHTAVKCSRKVCWPWRNGCVGGEGLPNLELLQIGGNKLVSAASVVFCLGSSMEGAVLLKWNVAKQYVRLRKPHFTRFSAGIWINGKIYNIWLEEEFSCPIEDHSYYKRMVHSDASSDSVASSETFVEDSFFAEEGGDDDENQSEHESDREEGNGSCNTNKEKLRQNAFAEKSALSAPFVVNAACSDYPIQEAIANLIVAVGNSLDSKAKPCLVLGQSDGNTKAHLKRDSAQAAHLCFSDSQSEVGGFEKEVADVGVERMEEGVDIAAGDTFRQ